MANADRPLDPQMSRLAPLGQIGVRGMVVHAGPPGAGSYAYYSDNQTESWRQFPVDLAVFARAHGLDPAAVGVLVTNNAPVAVFPPHADKRVVFANLNAFPGLPPDKAAPPLKGANGGLHDQVSGKLSSEFDALLIRFETKYYALASSQFHGMDAVNAGEAKILVRRGAVTAAIPNNDLPIGTNCVLVNLTQLLPPPVGQK